MEVMREREMQSVNKYKGSEELTQFGGIQEGAIDKGWNILKDGRKFTLGKKVGVSEQKETTYTKSWNSTW